MRPSTAPASRARLHPVADSQHAPLSEIPELGASPPASDWQWDQTSDAQPDKTACFTAAKRRLTFVQELLPSESLVLNKRPASSRGNSLQVESLLRNSVSKSNNRLPFSTPHSIEDLKNQNNYALTTDTPHQPSVRLSKSADFLDNSPATSPSAHPTRPKTAVPKTIKDSKRLGRSEESDVLHVRKINPPRSAPPATFTRYGYRLSSAATTSTRTVKSLPYKVSSISAPIKSSELVTAHNCKSRHFPRKQRWLDEIQEMEQKLIEKHTLATSGLTYEQMLVLRKTMDVGEPRRQVHRESTFQDKCWPPRSIRISRSAKTAVAAAAETRSVAFNTSMNHQILVEEDDEELGQFAEEFRMSDDDCDLSQNSSFEGFTRGSDNASLSETTEDTEDSFRDLISFKQRGPVSAAQRASTAGTSKRPSTAATTMTPRTSKVIRKISSSCSKTSSGVLSEAIDEFPIVLPSLLGDLLQPEPSLVSQASEPMDPIPQKHQKTPSELGDYYEKEENRSETESSTVSVEIQIQGVDTDTEYSVKRKLEFPSIDSSVTSSRQSSFMSNEFEDARSHSSLSLTTSSEVSTSSSSSSLKFKRNSKADKEQSEAMSEMEPIERDYKKMYSSLVDPSTLDDSLFNLLADVSYEDAVAETEMKIVLKELQHWAQSKFAPLFVDDLEEPQKFLKSFQLPVSRNDPQKLASRLDPRSSLATGKRLSNVSNSATNPTERPSGTSHHQGYRSSIVASIDGGEEKNKEFEELLQMTPWRPALEDSNRKEVGKGVSLEEKTPKTLVKRLKDAGMVDSGAIIDNTPVIDSIAVKRAKSATKAASDEAERQLAKKEAAQRLLQKRSKYGTGWYLDPNKWESTIKDHVPVNERKARQKYIKDTLNAIIDRQRAIYG